MKNVREGFFETNSSSSHSISISDKAFDKSNKGLYIEDDVCVIYPGEFGWGPEDFNDTPTKASYCLTYVKNYSPDLHDMLKGAIKKITGVSIVAFSPSSDGFYEWGYIDHQSYDVCQKVFESEENLINFIFNPKSVLKLDNDNH